MLLLLGKTLSFTDPVGTEPTETVVATVVGVVVCTFVGTEVRSWVGACVGTGVVGICVGSSGGTCVGTGVVGFGVGSSGGTCAGTGVVGICVGSSGGTCAGTGVVGICVGSSGGTCAGTGVAGIVSIPQEVCAGTGVAGICVDSSGGTCVDVCDGASVGTVSVGAGGLIRPGSPPGDRSDLSGDDRSLSVDDPASTRTVLPRMTRNAIIIRIVKYNLLFFALICYSSNSAEFRKIPIFQRLNVATAVFFFIPRRHCNVMKNPKRTLFTVDIQVHELFPELWNNFGRYVTLP